jgi:hypothetical protein
VEKLPKQALYGSGGSLALCGGIEDSQTGKISTVKSSIAGQEAVSDDQCMPGNQEIGRDSR